MPGNRNRQITGSTRDLDTGSGVRKRMPVGRLKEGCVSMPGRTDRMVRDFYEKITQ